MYLVNRHWSRSLQHEQLLMLSNLNGSGMQRWYYCYPLSGICVPVTTNKQMAGLPLGKKMVRLQKSCGTLGWIHRCHAKSLWWKTKLDSIPSLQPYSWNPCFIAGKFVEESGRGELLDLLGWPICTSVDLNSFLRHECSSSLLAFLGDWGLSHYYYLVVYYFFP